MRKLNWMSGVLWAASGLLSAQTVPAQVQGNDQGHARPSTMSMMADCPMMGAMTRGPDAVLSSRNELALTDAQANRLETILATEMQATNQAADSMRAVHKELAALSAAQQFDESAVRRVLDRMGALNTASGTAMLRATHDAEAVLTAEQQKKLRGRAGTMGAMGMMNMSGMNMSGMAGDSTMHGGTQNMRRTTSMMGMSGCGMMHDSTGAGTHKH